MKYRELVEAVAGATGRSEEEVQQILDKTIDVMIDTLENLEPVAFGSFGVFRVECNIEKGERDPYTGKLHRYVRSRYVSLYPHRRLREKIYIIWYPRKVELDEVYCYCRRCKSQRRSRGLWRSKFLSTKSK